MSLNFFFFLQALRIFQFIIQLNNTIKILWFMNNTDSILHLLLHLPLVPKLEVGNHPQINLRHMMITGSESRKKYIEHIRPADHSQCSLGIMNIQSGRQMSQSYPVTIMKLEVCRQVGELMNVAACP